jgi:hypothetical protein
MRENATQCDLSTNTVGKHLGMVKKLAILFAGKSVIVRNLRTWRGALDGGLLII